MIYIYFSESFNYSRSVIDTKTIRVVKIVTFCSFRRNFEIFLLLPSMLHTILLLKNYAIDSTLSLLVRVQCMYVLQSNVKNSILLNFD